MGSPQMVVSPVNTDLAPLHRLLHRIAGHRRRVRLTIAGLGAAAILLGLVLALFVLDWSLQLSRELRIVALAAATLIAGAMALRYVLPWVRIHESELDVALLLEKHQGIDSDLVAALQFERPEAATWGSVELQRHVMRRVADLAPKLPLVRDVPRSPLRRRLAAALIALGFLGLLWLLVPEHFHVFTRRILLADIKYPTATRLVAVLVNGQPISTQETRAHVRIPAGQPVRVEVLATGRLPSKGTVALSAPGKSRRIIEQPLEKAPKLNQTNFPTPAEFSEDTQRYSTELPPLKENVQACIFLGDSSTGWFTLECVSPPLVTLLSYVEDPRNENAPSILTGVTQFAVTEGSRVTLGISSNRPLKKVVAVLDRLEVPLSKTQPPWLSNLIPPKNFQSSEIGSVGKRDGLPFDRVAEMWWLDPTGLPLSEITEPLHVVFEIIDSFDIGVTPPMEAMIQVRPDFPPYITVKTLTRYVLPTARPTLVAEVRDDLGIDRVVARAQVIHPDGASGTPVEWTLWQRSQEALKILQEQWKLDLTPLACQKGDRIEITITATDVRGGGRPGKTASTDPVVFEVTDRAGILSLMSELDRKSAQQLGEMIEKQLDVGGGP